MEWYFMLLSDEELSELVKEFDDNDTRIKEYEENVNELTEHDVNKYNKLRIRNIEIKEKIQKEGKIRV